MSTTVDIFETSPRRRFMMDKADTILSAIHNPAMLVECYAGGMCASPNYMLRREAAKVSSLTSEMFRYKDDVISLEELRFFTKLSGNCGNGIGYVRNCKIILCAPNWTALSADGIRRCNSLELIVCGKKLATINARNFYQLYQSGYGKQNNRLTVILLYPSAVVSLNSNNTNSAATIKDIYVPDDLVDDYKETGTWASTYASKIYGLSDLPSQYLKYVHYYD